MSAGSTWTINFPTDVDLIEVEVITSDDRFIPEYKTDMAAGVDLMAAIEEPVTLAPGEVKLIPTGLKMFINDSLVAGFIFPRSGNGVKKGLVLANTVGVIDADYQGEIQVAAFNRNHAVYGDTITIEPGDRIAQLVFMPIAYAHFKKVDTFSEASDRGEGGFGSTGK